MSEPRSARVQHSVRLDADNPKQGMTLDEIGAFVQAAMKQEIPGDTVVKAVSTWKQSIKRMEIEG